jgi:hypothetical protein
MRHGDLRGWPSGEVSQRSSHYLGIETPSGCVTPVGKRHHSLDEHGLQIVPGSSRAAVNLAAPPASGYARRCHPRSSATRKR